MPRTRSFLRRPRRTAARPPRAARLAALGLALAAAGAPAQTASAPPEAVPAAGTPFFAPRVGLVLDAGYGSRELALGDRGKGFRLGGAELALDTPIGPWLEGRLTAAAHSHDKKVEKHFEEAWLGTTALPGGLQARAGRFLSQVGYLNEQHPHADDFASRPLLHRAFLGGHYFDDGLRLNWTAPTALYWRTGLEVFRGRKLTAEAGRRPRPGVWTLSTRLGGDAGREHSWQLGLSYLGNRRAAFIPHDDEHEHGHEEGHGGHAHGAQLAGRHLWVIDGVWKWAPEGNNRDRQLRLSFELARQTGLGEGAAQPGANRSAYLAAVWRFGGQWEVGARADWLSAKLPHGDHFHAGRLREVSLMAAWKPSHQQTLRLQVTRQGRAQGFDNPGTAVYVQYIHSFGAHGAHSF